MWRFSGAQPHFSFGWMDPMDPPRWLKDWSMDFLWKYMKIITGDVPKLISHSPNRFPWISLGFPMEWPSTRVCHPPSQWGLPEFFAMSTEFQQSSNRDKMATQAEMRMVKLTRNDITELGHPENQRSGSMLDLRWFLGHMHDDCCMEWLYDGSNFLKTASWRRRIDMTCKKHDLPSGNQT